MLIVSSIFLLLVTIVLLFVLFFKQVDSEEELSKFDSSEASEESKVTKIQLQSLMSSQRITSTGALEIPAVRKQAVEEDALTRLAKIESRITKGLKILEDLTETSSDFTKVVASGKVAKLHLFGVKFLKVVQGRAAKAMELKNSTAMSENDISKFIVRSFTVEMSVMNDLVDRENYITAVSWKDLTSMIEKYENDIVDVSKLMKSNRQGVSPSS